MPLRAFRVGSEREREVKGFRDLVVGLGGAGGSSEEDMVVSLRSTDEEKRGRRRMKSTLASPKDEKRGTEKLWMWAGIFRH